MSGGRCVVMSTLLVVVEGGGTTVHGVGRSCPVCFGGGVVSCGDEIVSESCGRGGGEGKEEGDMQEDIV